MPRLTRAAALLATLFVLVVACGPGAGDASNEPSTSPSTAPSGEPSAGASIEPGASEGGGVVYIVNVADDPELGAFLTGEDGRTLYIFTNDSPDTSTCASGCIENWPAFTLGGAGSTVEGGPGVTGELGTITRADGDVQVTYDHQPLYYYVGDTAAGDTNGHDLGGVWFVALVSGESGSTSPSPSAGKGDY